MAFIINDDQYLERVPGIVSPQRVLAIGAHPDDIEIGCGGSLIKHRRAGHDISVLVITQGERGAGGGQRFEETNLAASLFRCRLLMGELPDTEVSEARETISIISEAIDVVQPTIIYTHGARDHHQDHRAVHHASLVAARNVKNIYCYQSPSATTDFFPTRFVNIDEAFDDKLEVIRAHHSQFSTRPYLDPDYLRITASYWARFGHGRYCEAFEVVKMVDDIERPYGRRASGRDAQRDDW